MLDKIDQDLKQALLAGEKPKAETLRGLKSALHNEVISKNAQESGLSDEQIQAVLAREAKKRTEAAELYQKNGAADRAESELAEKKIIETYLPAQVSREEISKAVQDEIAKLSSPTMADMGKIIGGVRAKLGAGADGAVIAQLAKEALGTK